MWLFGQIVLSKDMFRGCNFVNIFKMWGFFEGLYLVVNVDLYCLYGVFDYCSMGVVICKQVCEFVGSIFEKVQVIYVQIDSVFVCFKDVSIDDVIKLGI